MAGREEQERRKAHTLLAARQARAETQRETLNLLTGLIEQVGPEQAVYVAVGYLQMQLGMTKPFSEIKKGLKRGDRSNEVQHDDL
jgi:hypothetical protein